jgi:excisionase family DNA binding protein
MESLTSQVKAHEPVGRQTYLVKDVSEILGISLNAAYNFVKEGNFRVVRIGTSIRIAKESFDKWLKDNEM